MKKVGYLYKFQKWPCCDEIFQNETFDYSELSVYIHICRCVESAKRNFTKKYKQKLYHLILTNIFIRIFFRKWLRIERGDVQK